MNDTSRNEEGKKWMVVARYCSSNAWAATGPAMEAYSKHPVVKKANESGQVMTVSEFLRSVRRIVVDFVVGRVPPPITAGRKEPAGWTI